MDLFNISKTKHVIDSLREQYPNYCWSYNRRGFCWGCEVGVVRKVAIIGGYTGDDYLGSELYFYRNDGEKTERVFI